jgi:MFS family permease
MDATQQVRRHGLRAFMPLVQMAALIEWTGTGLFLAVSALYFVKIVGLGAAAVGTGLAIAGAVAMATGPLVARSTGRYGPRRVLVGMNLARALATYAYLWIDSWRSFLCVAVVVAIAEQSTPPLIQAYVGDRAPQDLRVRVMAVQRTIVNVGISLGGLIAGASLGAGSRASFRWLLIGGVAAYIAVALMLLATRGDSSARPATRGIAPLMKDRRLLGFSLFNAVMSLWTPMLNVAFPLWLVTRTAIPERVVGILYAVNTVACITLQYPMNRYTRSPRSAWWSYSAAGLLLVIACLGFAAAPALSMPVALTVFTGGILILTIAEILQVGASWTLSFEMAPEQARGTYLVLFGMGRTIGNKVAGPLLMTGVVLALGVTGWISLAAIFALSATVPLAVLSARRNRRSATAEPLPQPTYR